MNLAQLQALARSVGFPDANLAAAVAMAESGGNPNAVGDVALGGSIGLWQIFTQAHPNYDRDQLTDPTYNAEAAYAISSGGTDWTPWSTYNSGAYLQYYSGPSSWLTPGKVAVAALAAAGGVIVYKRSDEVRLQLARLRAGIRHAVGAR